MPRRVWIVLDVVVLLICLGAAVASWRGGLESIRFLVVEDQPAFTAVRYSGPWVALAALLVAIAGLAVIDLVARCVARSR
ncbi:hypothetical protein [Nocardia alni]|uniref:hypothetical protein n=1 Tax=Nocardia alni TaxID=2815723 RepID=UPI001C218117|nr:hypothetical protein [Nocardia alni]